MYKRITVYPNGTPIPEVLPDSYQPAAYGDAPAGQSCFNCSHFNLTTRYCDKWQAPVKPRWWCAAWEPALKVALSNSSPMLSKKITTSTVEEHFSQIPNVKSTQMDYDFYNENEEDVIKLNVPLMIRLLEYAREDVTKDADLHVMVEKLTELCEYGEVLEMKDYETIISKED